MSMRAWESNLLSSDKFFDEKQITSSLTYVEKTDCCQPYSMMNNRSLQALWWKNRSLQAIWGKNRSLSAYDEKKIDLCKPDDEKMNHWLRGLWWKVDLCELNYEKQTSVSRMMKKQTSVTLWAGWWKNRSLWARRRKTTDLYEPDEEEKK